jgi:hypothetical protein
MQGFKSAGSAQRFLSVHAQPYRLTCSATFSSPLAAWAKEARKQCADCARTEIGDNQIGKSLARAGKPLHHDFADKAAAVDGEMVDVIGNIALVKAFGVGSIAASTPRSVES